MHDHPALHAASETGAPVIPVFVWSPEEEGDWPTGGASRWWMHHSLTRLDESLRAVGSRLVIRRGAAEAVLAALMEETGAGEILWNRRYEPAVIARDTKLKARFPARSFNGSLLYEPGSVLNKSGKPFQVFTPFYKTCLKREEVSGVADPLPAPGAVRAPAAWPDSLALEALELLPKIAWDGGFKEVWSPGEAGAAAQLERFLDGCVPDYKAARDVPSLAATSRLSPHLHHGELSPRQVWHAVKEFAAANPGPGNVYGAEEYLREVVWREFAFQLLFHFPHTPKQPLREKYAKFPWRRDAKALRAWQRGQTGYPLVDAGMRELLHTGWMHNRVRMVVASFLVKHLLLSWEHGAAWFWDTLVDADLASNTLGWQWAGGCGADAAPYFRIFNPTTQGEKFDGEGNYTRHWVPELAGLPDKWLFKPWEAAPLELAAAGVTLGKTYPRPIVDHKEARARALEALASLKEMNV